VFDDAADDLRQRERLARQLVVVPVIEGAVSYGRSEGNMSASPAAEKPRQMSGAVRQGPLVTMFIRRGGVASPAVATGLSRREIGAQLYISLNTVKPRTRELYGKLGATSRADAVARAEALGLLERTESPG
jgi:DNA-binding NarL/FixJ family response regulator